MCVTWLSRTCCCSARGNAVEPASRRDGSGARATAATRRPTSVARARWDRLLGETATLNRVQTLRGLCLSGQRSVCLAVSSRSRTLHIFVQQLQSSIQTRARKLVIRVKTFSDVLRTWQILVILNNARKLVYLQYASYQYFKNGVKCCLSSLKQSFEFYWTHFGTHIVVQHTIW